MQLLWLKIGSYNKNSIVQAFILVASYILTYIKSVVCFNVILNTFSNWNYMPLECLLEIMERIASICV